MSASSQPDRIAHSEWREHQTEVSRHAKSRASASTLAVTSYYFTLVEVASFLRTSRSTLHRWLDPQTGIIQCPNGKCLATTKFGERRLVARGAWESFIAAGTSAMTATTPMTPVPQPKRRGRPRRGI